MSPALPVRVCLLALSIGALATAAPAWARTQGWDWDEQGYVGPAPTAQPARTTACSAAPLSQFVVDPLAADAACADAPTWG